MERGVDSIFKMLGCEERCVVGVRENFAVFLNWRCLSRIPSICWWK